MQVVGVKLTANYTLYKSEPTLGQGAFGVVYKGYSKKDNCIVAIKKLKPEAATKWHSDPQFQQELKILQQIRHPNVMKVYDSIEVGKDVYIVMEFCESGDLKKLIMRSQQEKKERGEERIPGRGALSSVLIFDILCQLCEGMIEVNRNKYMHRDLKLDNILFNKEGIVKIADFGLARGFIGDNIYKMELYSMKGTPYYVAPNILRREAYSAKCDVFSAGVVIYELLTGVHPFAEARNISDLKNLHTIKLDNKRITLPQGVDDAFDDVFDGIVSKMITYREEDRTTFEQLYKDIGPARLKIGRTLDPRYEYVNVLTGKRISAEEDMLASSSLEKYFESLDQQNSERKTGPSMQQQQNEQSFQNMRSDLIKFVTYIYERGRLMINLMARLNPPGFPLSNFHKYVLAVLELGIFMNENAQIKKYLSEPVITLPSGVLFNRATLSKKHKDIIEKEIAYFLEGVKKQQDTYAKFIKQIYDKLSSADYQKRYASIYEKYPEIYEMAEKIALKNTLSDEGFFTFFYEEFLKNQCQIRDYRKQPEEVARTYNMALTFCNLKTYLPDSQYQSADSIAEAVQYFNKASMESVYARIDAITASS